MIKKIALGGIFMLASLITMSTATATKAEATTKSSSVSVPTAPVPQGWCMAGGRC